MSIKFTNPKPMNISKVVFAFLLLLSTVNLFSQGLDCNTATPYCDAPGGSPVSFPNNTNNSSEAGPNYGCLTTHPNPAWFYFKTTTAGNYTFDLGQGSSCGTTNLDVDFICWGPFTNPLTACNNLTAGNTVDCSYSPSAVEQINVNGAPAGQYYIVLITNYANAAGCVQFGLTASSPPTDCSITCASVLSGPGIVSLPSSSPLSGTPATPMPASVACNSGLQNMYATNLSPFGNPITPGVMVSFPNNANASNNVTWLEAGTPIGCFGPSASCQPLTTSYNNQLQFSYMSPSAVNQFSFCETNSAQPNMTTNIKDLAGGANIPGAPFSWNDDGACQTINIPAGTIKGISTWTSTCGACLTGVTDWGAAQFNPAAAGIGTHTITYSFNSQQAGCTTYTTSITITVTNPYNAAFVTPGPFCAGASCATLTPSNTYTVGTGTFSGTGVSGNTFCPATSGVGSFPVTYTIGVSPTCRATQTNTITVNANPTANAGSPAVLTCTNTSVGLTGSGGSTYSWTGPAGGISSGGNTATPTVTLAGTYTVLVANGTCTSSATVAVTQNTATPAVTPAVSGALNCTVTSVNASATTTSTPVTYNWTGPGITAGGTTGTVSVNQPGTYNYTVTYNGCKTTGSQVVSQNTLTPAVAPAVSGVLNCTVSSVNASATTTTTPVSYNWTGPGITAGATTGTVAVNQPGTYNYTVTATNGCSVTGSQAVTQNTATPSVAAAVSGALNCTLTSVNASATTTSTPVTYNWTGPGITAGATTGTIAVNQGGTYNYTVLATNGCSVTGSQAVTQNTATPSVAAAVTGSLNCSVTSVDASATTTSTPVSYNWTGPSITAGAGTGTITVDQPGTYNYTVTNTTNGCSVTASQAVTQNTTVPTANAGTTQTLVCGVSSVTLTGSGNAGSNATWLGGVCGSATSFTTTACAPGTYTLVATDAVSTCTNSSTVSVSSSTNVPQATVNAITNSITCTNSVVAIGVTYSGTDPVTYVWSGPGITGSTTSSVTTANLSGTYNVTITNISSNCQSVYSAVVPTNTTPVTANITPPASVTCVTSTISLIATPTGTNYAYSWSGPGTITNGTTDNPTVDASGNYVVTITDNINGCVGSFTATVGSNTIAPTLSLSATSLTTSCSTPTVTLNASSDADPSSTYSWTASAGGTLSNPSINNPVALSGGSYDVVVTNTVNGCVSAVQTVSVTADANIPTFTLTSTSVSLTCLSSSETVTLTSTSNDLTYSWSPAPSAGGTTSTPTFNAPGTYVCVITNTVNNCSTGAAQVAVTSSTNVPTMAIPAGVLTCSFTTITLSGVSNPTSGLSYSWSGPGIVGSTTSSSVDVNLAGNYDVILLDAANGCTNTISTSVTSNTTAPALNVTATSTVLSCAISSSTLSAGPTATWSTPSGPASDPVIAGVAGNYVATITDATNGCSTSSTITVSGSTVAPTADAGISASIPCGTPTVALNGTTTSTDVVTYDWSGPNAGSISGPTNVQNPIVMDAGVYTLTVTNTASGCSATATINVTQANVNAAFTANPTNGLTPLDVNFTDASTGVINNYNWDFGDGSSTSPAINPNHTFTTGTYTVTLTVSSGPCVSTATTVIVVEDGLTLEIPNVFTPNGDGSNDIFFIKSTGVKEISLQVFNRWGQKLYEFTGPKASWDGSTPGGKEVPEGTYFYFVKATGFDDSKIEKHGTVNLFR